jgi:hypothetical protein
MKKLILIVCLFAAFLMQGCVAYVPADRDHHEHHDDDHHDHEDHH